MGTAEFIDTLRREGPLLADAAAKAGLDAPVPTCPDWRVRDLLTHIGAVHRWAADYVIEGRTAPGPMDVTAPGDAELADWYRQTHRRLTEALTAAPADMNCWSFFTAPSPLAFWARRQAHETTIHRVDAQVALGEAPSPVDTAFAADGVDELLADFHGRQYSRVRTDRPQTLLVRAPDSADDWLVHLSPEPPVTERGAPGAYGTADCTVSGRAADLYLALWNRGSYDTLAVEGDDALVELWRQTAAVG